MEVKYSFKMKESFESYLKLVSETSSYPLILPFCKTSTDITWTSPLKKLIYLTFSTPLIGDRYLVVRVDVKDNIEKDGVVILSGHGLS